MNTSTADSGPAMPVPKGPVVRLGQAIYPYRGAFGVPLLVAVLLLGHPRPFPWPGFETVRSMLGWIVLFLGLGIRTWGVACWFTRDEDGIIGGRRLMTDEGPYAFTRNPRYLGNLGMGLGVAILAGIPEGVVLFASLWCAVHYPIIVAEAATLEEKFGEEYLRYRERVPAFWPRSDGTRSMLGQVLGLDWVAGTLEEMGTLTGWACLGLFVEWWRAAHLAGSWRAPGSHWIFLLLIPVVLVLGQMARRWLKADTFAQEDRPLAP